MRSWKEHTPQSMSGISAGRARHTVGSLATTSTQTSPQLQHAMLLAAQFRLLLCPRRQIFRMLVNCLVCLSYTRLCYLHGVLEVGMQPIRQHIEGLSGHQVAQRLPTSCAPSLIKSALQPFLCFDTQRGSTITQAVQAACQERAITLCDGANSLFACIQDRLNPGAGSASSVPWQCGEGLRSGAATRAPCRMRACHGLLLLQQRGGGRTGSTPGEGH